ncbi:DUF4011 domain-containing anti-phage protein Hhe [Endozoicomonas sp. YOMI1]|uniref:DUF4011 domain-containing anti-phage protein Hhe n=1 Tax=Endozoicomonas sp. YOMI1 TaxID=2828739 RepID=UPI0021482994|nr:DUF4011 domain-containing anti-phage protein Hhe [Endozoicomonas sp. YOMI1]
MEPQNPDAQTNPQGFAYDSLESVRKKLLDLTSRNTLLNYRHPKATSVRVIETNPDNAAKALLDEKSLIFMPVPEPTESELIDAGYFEEDPAKGHKVVAGFPSAEQWAKHLGHYTSYELKDFDASLQKSDNFQTLSYASELEARLRGLRGKAETAIEESGANILYLGIGFLEWYESRDSDKARQAPLFTIPVKLEKSAKVGKDGVYRYSLSLKDEGLLTNISLREKLANDFGLFLPGIEEDTVPSVYFERIRQSILKEQPRWKVKQHISLILLNFTKQAMYLDLDPENWPENANIKDHPTIAQFFSAAGQENPNDSATYEDEHNIDTVEDIHLHYPLVFDADSSQHSAVIDAAKGENLVIEGPPGSGKSQTITNIIAACIGNGKKVLFFAEKMAALNVVKDRLDRAGLGDFCLELHSHKTNKQKVLGDLGHRLNKKGSYREPKEIEAEVARFEDLKSKLADYVSLINSYWSETGLTLHQILNKATRYREQLHISPELLAIEGIDGKSFTPVKQRELLDQAEMLTNVYESVSNQAQEGKIANHHWYGVNNTELQGYQIDEVADLLRQWTEKLTALKVNWESFSVAFDLHNSVDSSFEAIERATQDINKLPMLMGEEPLGAVYGVVNLLLQSEQMLDQYKKIHGAYDAIFKHLKPEAFEKEIGREAHLDKTLTLFQRLGVNVDKNLNDIALSLNDLASAEENLAVINSSFSPVYNNVSPPLQRCFVDTSEGLKEFAILAQLIGQLPSDLWRHRDDLYDNPDLDPLLEQMTSRLSQLTPLYHELHEAFSLHRLPDTATLKVWQSLIESGGLFKWFSGEWRSARKSVLSLSALPKPDANQLLSLLPKLIQYSEGLEQMDQLNRGEQILDTEYCGIETPIDRLVEIRKWYKAVRNEYGAGFGKRVAIGNALLSLDRNQAMAIKELADREVSGLLGRVQQDIRKLSELYSGYIQFQDSGACLSQSMTELSQTIEAEVEILNDVLTGDNVTIGDLNTVKTLLTEQATRLSAWQTNQLVQHFVDHGLALSEQYRCYSERDFQLVQNTLDVASVMNGAPYLLSGFQSDFSAKRYEGLQEGNRNLCEDIQDVLQSRAEFAEVSQVNLQEWFEASSDDLQGNIERNEKALTNPVWLTTWLKYIKSRKRLSSGGLEKVVQQLELQNISSEMLNDVVHMVSSHQLSREILQQHPSLGNFSGSEQMAVRKKFQEYDRKLMKLQQELIAHKTSIVSTPKGIASGKVKDYTELSLIKYNLNLKKPRIAIRSLLKRAPMSIQALKPCFLMSPMSVAQYLEPGNYDFDMIIMDEASQIRPEDALGAIARGTSLVVVGDPKQLPPTSFFQKTVDSEDNDDKVALEDSESILDSVIPLFKSRRLRWHYRSRHESLIAFSNQNFYDSNLILFPSPFSSSDEFGIRYQPIQGRFVNRRNEEEARILVQGVADQLINKPEESVGIVAMNSEQSDEIEKQLEQKIKDDPALQLAFEKNQELDEPLFVKNLENVQGDERDVIVISMTYGPETIGANAMHQRFGPINSNVGWRRLNVLFTRSKKRMHIYSSMRSGHVRTSDNSSRGVKALKAFLEYCETGRLQHYQHTGKEPDSDFEVAVMQMLAEHGYECEPQLGVAGYFLDLAVKDPGMPGRFLMGIECDGASYHSAKSTRDRDRLRQEILENLGWKIRRIWSTDWFDNPQAPLREILTELDSLKTPLSQAPATNDQTLSSVKGDSQPEPIQDQMFEDSGDVNAEKDLQTILVEYDQTVIRQELPDTDE